MLLLLGRVYEGGGLEGCVRERASSAAAPGGPAPAAARLPGPPPAPQAARFADPKYPVVRLQPSIPRLHFFLSPGRMGRLLRVLRAALPAGEQAPGGGAGGGGAAAAGATALEPWRQQAEQEGGVRVLTWSGLGYSSATWCPRHAVLYQVGVPQRAQQPLAAATPCCGHLSALDPPCLPPAPTEPAE